MANALAQIVCVREDGKDPRTVVAMAPVAEQLKAIKTLTKWPGQSRRPHLEIWSDAGAKLDPKTGEPITKQSAANRPGTES